MAHSTVTYDAYVQGFGSETNRDSLKKLFSEFGVVKYVWVNSKSSNSPQRSALVKFTTYEALDSAVKEMNGYLLHGHTLTVLFNRKHKRPPWRSKELPCHTKAIHSHSPAVGSNLRKARIYVTHVESSFEFWGQFDEASRDLDDLTNSLNAYCDSKPTTRGDVVDSSEIYGSLFSADNVWYRCQIVNKISPAEAVIRYIDYGNMETVATNSLVPLPGHLKVPSYSSKFLITDLQQENRPLKSVDSLIEILLDNLIEATIRNDVTVGTYKINPSVLLLTSGKSIEIDLMEAMLKNSDEGSISIHATDIVEKASFSPLTPESSPEKFFPIDAQLSEARNKITFVEKENSELKSSLEEQTERVQQLKEEHASHVEQLKVDHSEELASAVEQSMQLQINSMIDKVQYLKQCRSNTPTGVPPLMEDAVKLVLAEDGKVDLSGITCVEKAVAVFESAQQAIRDCSKKSDLEQLVLTRDSARIELSDAINAFLVHTQNKLNFHSKEGAVTKTVKALEKMFPDQPRPVAAETKSIREAVESYRAWLEIVIVDHERSVEKCTSTLQALRSGLKSIDVCLCLDEEAQCERAVPDISKLFRAYSSAVDDEIKKRKQFSHSSLLDAEETRSLCASLLSALKQEQKDLLTLRDSLNTYSKLQLAVDKWLVARPDVTPVQACRQTMRMLRIDFGHKMVERKELIQDGDVEELKQIEEQVAEIRKKLHMAFIQESLEMENLATMLSQFPELPALCPQMHLQDFVVSGGLLKTGRSIEHFQRIEQLKNVDHPSFRSKFNDQPCVIKEFNLTATGSLGTLLLNARSLNAVKTHSLVSVHSIFKDETNKAYIQLSDYGTLCVSDWMKSKPDESAIRSVCHQVLETLMALHAAGVVYGPLKPSFVWVSTPEGGGPPTAILSDFSLDQDLRSRCKVLPESSAEGNSFDAQSDMYCFGLFLLWTVNPEASLVHDPEGNPRLTKFSLPSDLHSLLEGLLHANPKLRLAATTVTSHPFFTSHFPELSDSGNGVNSLVDAAVLPALSCSDKED